VEISTGETRFNSFISAIIVAGGVFVLPILGVVVFTRPKDGRQASEYRYSIADFDDK
jgi:hypothetical protein